MATQDPRPAHSPADLSRALAFLELARPVVALHAGGRAERESTMILTDLGNEALLARSELDWLRRTLVLETAKRIHGEETLRELAGLVRVRTSPRDWSGREDDQGVVNSAYYAKARAELTLRGFLPQE